MSENGTSSSASGGQLDWLLRSCCLKFVDQNSQPIMSNERDAEGYLFLCQPQGELCDNTQIYIDTLGVTPMHGSPRNKAKKDASEE